MSSKGLPTQWTISPAAIGLCLLLAVLISGGCKSSSKTGDPFEKSNRVVYGFNEHLDRYVLTPTSDAYIKVTPRPVRKGISNAFDNLHCLNVILNDLLQLRFKQGWNDTERAAVNTTVGVLGFIDVATGWDLPAHENDFGMTLGRWGTGAGPYLVLPFFGPSTGRDAPGLAVSYVTNPLRYIDMTWELRTAIDVTSVLDTRSQLDEAVRLRERAAIDPYLFTRDFYLQHRRAKILGEPPPADDDFYDVGPEPTTRPAATQPVATSATLGSEK